MLLFPHILPHLFDANLCSPSNSARASSLGAAPLSVSGSTLLLKPLDLATQRGALGDTGRSHPEKHAGLFALDILRFFGVATSATLGTRSYLGGPAATVSSEHTAYNHWMSAWTCSALTEHDEDAAADCFFVGSMSLLVPDSGPPVVTRTAAEDRYDRKNIKQGSFDYSENKSS
ncbi:hypothetical protein ACGC1H_005219 [Rhizoctonia solani]